jgi:transcriptional regulator with XRE-family HTH domain
VGVQNVATAWDGSQPLADAATTMEDVAEQLRWLRRRQARRRGEAPLTYRELAAKTGWSHGIIGAYLTGKVLPPTDRFDVLIRLLGATAAELGALATGRDRVEEVQRVGRAPAVRVVPRQLPGGVPGFTGREAVLARLDELAETGGSPVVAAVSGTAGAGKTNPGI